MNATPQPSDIAREALRQLAMRRITPTPDNYRALYQEIAGAPPTTEAFPEKAMKAVAASLPRATPMQLQFARRIDAAVAERDWATFKTTLVALMEPWSAPKPAWSTLIRDLLVQLERRQKELTPAQKREALDRVLESSAGDADNLFPRLHSLVRTWSEAVRASAKPFNCAAVQASAGDRAAQAAPTHTAAENTQCDTVEKLRELLAQLLEDAAGIFATDAPELSQDAQALLAELSAVDAVSPLDAFSSKLQAFSLRLKWVAEDEFETKAALKRVLQLLIENISELVFEDSWLHGQISIVRDQVSGSLDARRLDDVERRLKEAISRQSILRKDLSDAKNRIKTMLGGFVAHLANITESTGEYHMKMERCATRISCANDISELGAVVDELMHETRTVRLNVERSHDEMQTMQARVEEADREIMRLQDELAQTSELVRHDHLTGALNRKGMEEIFERELARAKRRSSPLCVALIDIDNFKQLNDSYGHTTGDDALVHIARVARESLRPNDTLARYGGEEFLILLPDTELEGAVAAVTRLQRSLTRTFFLHDNEKLLITFSAGVAQYTEGETREQAIARADSGMYQAKRTGKNRVIAVS